LICCIFPVHAKNGPRSPPMGQGGFFPTNPGLAYILGNMDFDFENFFGGFFGSRISRFPVPRFPNSQPGPDQVLGRAGGRAGGGAAGRRGRRGGGAGGAAGQKSQGQFPPPLPPTKRNTRHDTKQLWHKFLWHSTDVYTMAWHVMPWLGMAWGDPLHCCCKRSLNAQTYFCWSASSKGYGQQGGKQNPVAGTVMIPAHDP